jgi:hypothetical protein
VSPFGELASTTDSKGSAFARLAETEADQIAVSRNLERLSTRQNGLMLRWRD